MGRSIESGPESPEGRPELEPEVTPNPYSVVVGVRPHDPATFVTVWKRDHLPLAQAIEGLDYIGLYRVDAEDPIWPYVMDLGWPSKKAHDASIGTESRNAALAHIRSLADIDVVFRVEELFAMAAE